MIFKKLIVISSIGFMLTSIAEPTETFHIKFRVGYQHILIRHHKNTEHKKTSIQDIKNYIKYKNPKIGYKIMLGICNIESSFDEKAKNKNSSATGCMQIIHGTGKFIHTNLLKRKAEYVHSKNLEYRYNIDLATAYLDWLYEKYNGNQEKIILAYRGEKDLIYLKKVFAYSRKTI